MRILLIGGIVLGLAASAAWTAFLGYEMLRALELIFQKMT